MTGEELCAGCGAVVLGGQFDTGATPGCSA
jgi:hypothetical protein